MNLFNIINGHAKEILNINQDLSNSRLKICYACPLYTNKLGGMCNNKLWYNPNTGDISEEKKEGYKNGCGCRILAKTRLSNAICPLDKW